MLAAAAAAMALPSLVKGATSLYQMYQGNKLGKTKEEKYEIPESAKAALSSAQSQAAMKQLPGQGLMEDKLRRSTASGTNAVQQMGGGSAGMGAMVDMLANEQNKQSDLDIQAANMYQANQGMLRNQLGNMAGYERQQNQRDLDVYDQTMSESSDLKGAAMSNAFGAVKGGADSYFNYKALDELGFDFGESGLDKWRKNRSNNETGTSSNVYVDPRYNKM